MWWIKKRSVVECCSFSETTLAYCLVDEKPLLQRFLVTAGVEAVHQQQNTWELAIKGDLMLETPLLFHVEKIKVMQNMINLLMFGTRKHLYQKSESLHMDGHKHPALLHFDIRKSLLQERQESVYFLVTLFTHGSQSESENEWWSIAKKIGQFLKLRFRHLFLRQC
jgi:hypothetical protein